MITVHHLENSRSQRILWLLEELGAAYRVERYARDPRSNLAPASLREIHPLGKSPVIEDAGRVVAESGAIIEYLLDHHDPDGAWRPSREDEEAWRRYTYWLHVAEGSMMPYLVMKLVFHKVATVPPFFIRPIAAGLSKTVGKTFIDPNIRRMLTFAEAELSEGEGGFVWKDRLSGADVQMSFPLEAAAARAGMLEEFPRVRAFVERFQSRQAYQRALERGGPYELGM